MLLRLQYTFNKTQRKRNIKISLKSAKKSRLYFFLVTTKNQLVRICGEEYHRTRSDPGKEWKFYTRLAVTEKLKPSNEVVSDAGFFLDTVQWSSCRKPVQIELVHLRGREPEALR